MTITMELEKLDVLAILSALEDGVLTWRTHAAISAGDERFYAQQRAAKLRKAADHIIDTLYPDEQPVAA